MRSKRIWIPALAALVALLGAGLAVQGGEGDKTTVQGEIVDMACYVAKGAKGPDHAACAKACVKGGQPMGLLTKDGTVYLLYASHENGDAFERAKELAGTNVELTGLTASKAGVKGFEVHSVKAL